MKTGEVFTIERIVMGGTGYQYAVVHLTGGVALLNSEVVPMESGKSGAPQIQRFTFQALRPGKAEIQLARFRSFELDSVVYEQIMPFDVKPAEAKSLAVPGGWTPFGKLTSDDKKVFEQALERFVGVKYTPEKVSKQVVNGTHYRFFCYGKPIVPGDDQSFPAIVKIHAPINDRATIEEIQRVLL